MYLDESIEVVLSNVMEVIWLGVRIVEFPIYFLDILVWKIDSGKWNFLGFRSCLGWVPRLVGLNGCKYSLCI